MKKSISFMLLVTAIAINLSAQTADIKVLLAKGKVETWAGKNKPSLVVNSGTVIPKGDSIRLYDKAELVLVSGSKAMTVKDAGKYSSAKLNELFAKQGTAQVTSKFLNYLSKEMKPEHENYQDFAKAHMKEKGSVTRGPNCSAPIMIMPVKGTIAAPEIINFRWKGDGQKAFAFAIYTLPEDGPAFFKTDVKDSTLALNINEAKLELGKTYYWQVIVPGKPTCDRVAFSIISLDDANNLEADMKANRQLYFGNDEVSQLVQAALYEEKSFYLQADQLYRSLIVTNPMRDDIRQLYASFLGRMGLGDEATAALIKPKVAIKPKK